MALFMQGVLVASAAASSPVDPQTITLHPVLNIGATPSWAAGKPIITPGSDSVEIPVPSIASQDDIGSFALTVLFEDNGDGGPVVEWQSKDGENLLLSAGLGDSGVALGLNSRTLLIPGSMALDGGRLRISYAGRFARLLSLSLRPARDLAVAALGTGNFEPALLDGPDRILSRDDVSGTDIPLAQGDNTEGRVVHAELSSAPLRLDAPGTDGTTEFLVPMTSTPSGTYLRADTGGLDPESWIEVSVNGESLGALAPQPFALNDARVRFSESGRLLLAGWQPSSLYVPARIWKDGENSVILTLRRVPGDDGKAVYLRKVRLDLLFTPAGPTSPSASTSPLSPGQGTGPSNATQTLSTGSLYGNPSPALFHASSPVHLTPIPEATPSTP